MALRNITQLSSSQVLLFLLSILFSISAWSEITVEGDTISWPADGWYEVQNVGNFQSVCVATTECTVPAGEYNVINHTSGQRWDAVRVLGPNAPAFVGGTISFPSDGWYQVQEAENYETVCEAKSSCVVGSGTYNIINQTSGQRWDKVSVVQESIPVVVGNAIVFPDDSLYQVLEADSYITVCEGLGSCEVNSGSYIIINLTEGRRYSNTIVVNNASGISIGEEAESLESNSIESEGSSENSGISDVVNTGREQSATTDAADSAGDSYTTGDADTTVDAGSVVASAEEANDIDSDGLDNAVDNCPINYNPNQSDFDGNGIGNVCDKVTESCPCTEFGQRVIALREQNVYPFSDSSFTNLSLDFTTTGSIIVSNSYTPRSTLPETELALVFDNLSYQSSHDVMWDETKKVLRCTGLFDPYVRRNGAISFATKVDESVEKTSISRALACMIVLFPNKNPLEDSDSDGVLDIQDNCPKKFNPSQDNFDLNPSGDVCQPP